MDHSQIVGRSLKISYRSLTIIIVLARTGNIANMFNSESPNAQVRVFFSISALHHGEFQLYFLLQGCMNNITFGDEGCGYYETVAGGAGAVSRATV